MTNKQVAYILELEKLQQEIDDASKLMRILRICIFSKRLPKSLTFHVYQEKLDNLIKRKSELLKLIKEQGHE